MSGRKRWSDEEVALLKRLYPTHTAGALSERLGRSEKSIYAKAKNLGLRSTHQKWSDEKLAMVKHLYPIYTANDLSMLLGCSPQTIHNKASRLGFQKTRLPKHGVNAKSGQPWSSNEEAVLREHYASRDVSELSEKLKRSINAIHQKAHHLGLHKNNRSGTYKLWSKEEVETLTRLYPTTPLGELSRVLKRSKQSVRAMIRLQGLRKPEGFNHYAVPIGSVRINSDGTFIVKHTDKHKGARKHANWMPYLRWLWEKAGRQVPEGHFVTFKVGCRQTDPSKVTLDMLRCVTMSEFSRSIQQIPKPIREVQSLIRELSKETRVNYTDNSEVK